LLVGASLLLKSFVRLQNVNPGFDAKNVLTMEIALPVLKYPRGKPVADFYAEAQRRIKALPGVEAAAFASILPLSGTNSDSSFSIEGRNHMAEQVFPDEEIRNITPEYFSALKVPLLRGRFLNEGDQWEGPGVVVVNNTFAKKWWPNEDAVGKRITFSDTSKPDVKWITVVGIVGDMRHRGLDQDVKPEFYFAHNQNPYRNMILTVRSKQDPRSLTSAIRREISSLDPDLPAANVRTLEQVTADSIAPRRLSVALITVFAAVALVLASVGIYGVMSFLVVQRTHEMGVRMALGAQRRDVFALVIGRAAKLVLIGSAIGLVLAIISSRALSAMLYNVAALDVSTFALVTIALGAVALLASYIPAQRATKADPMIALGHGA
jgi:predicted permease